MSTIHYLDEYHCYGGGALGEWIAFSKYDLSTLSTISWGLAFFYGSDFAMMLGILGLYVIQICAFLISTITADPRPEILLLPCRDTSYGLPDYTVVATMATVLYVGGYVFMKDTRRSSWYSLLFIAYAGVYPLETWFNGYTDGAQTFFSIGMALIWTGPLVVITHIIFVPLDAVVPYFPIFEWLGINNSLSPKKHE